MSLIGKLSRLRPAANPNARSRLKKGSALLALCVATVGVYEGLRTFAYRDIVGVPTVCFGETRGVQMGDRYSIEECRSMLGDALVEFETGMRACLRAPDTIPAKPYAAHLSATYNIGVGAFCRSSMARRLNAGDLRGSCDALRAWNKAGGRVVKGLTRRREEERALCLEGL